MSFFGYRLLDTPQDFAKAQDEIKNHLGIWRFGSGVSFITVFVVLVLLFDDMASLPKWFSLLFMYGYIPGLFVAYFWRRKVVWDEYGKHYKRAVEGLSDEESSKFDQDINDLLRKMGHWTY